MRTDLMSLGAIGLGAAVAVVGTGAMLVTGTVQEWDADLCLELAEVSFDGSAGGAAAGDTQLRMGCATERVEMHRQVDEIRVRALTGLEASRAEAETIRVEVESAEFQTLLGDLRADADVTREISEVVRARIEKALAEARTSRTPGN